MLRSCPRIRRKATASRRRQVSRAPSIRCDVPVHDGTPARRSQRVNEFDESKWAFRAYAPPAAAAQALDLAVTNVEGLCVDLMGAEMIERAADVVNTADRALALMSRPDKWDISSTRTRSTASGRKWPRRGWTPSNDLSRRRIGHG